MTDACPICTNALTDQHGQEPNGPVNTTHCGHRFHYACLDYWYQTARTCPTCRVPVPSIYGTATPQHQHENVSIYPAGVYVSGEAVFWEAAIDFGVNAGIGPGTVYVTGGQGYQLRADQLYDIYLADGTLAVSGAQPTDGGFEFQASGYHLP